MSTSKLTTKITCITELVDENFKTVTMNIPFVQKGRRKHEHNKEKYECI